MVTSSLAAQKLYAHFTPYGEIGPAVVWENDPRMISIERFNESFVTYDQEGALSSATGDGLIVLDIDGGHLP